MKSSLVRRNKPNEGGRPLRTVPVICEKIRNGSEAMHRVQETETIAKGAFAAIRAQFPALRMVEHLLGRTIARTRTVSPCEVRFSGTPRSKG